MSNNSMQGARTVNKTQSMSQMASLENYKAMVSDGVSQLALTANLQEQLVTFVLGLDLTSLGE